MSVDSIGMARKEQSWTERWQTTWMDFAGDPPEGVLDDLLVRYKEPHRYYHSLTHLAECLTAFDLLKSQCLHPAEVALALWFHDAVYDTHAQNNEAQSAALAFAALRESGACAEVLTRIERLIMCTGHAKMPEDEDEGVVVDCDLAILGATPERFTEYENQIRREYEWVPLEAYCDGRLKVLQSFMSQSCLYSTAQFQARYEVSARENLTRSIEALSQLTR